jgi:hypothetical protein
VFLYLVRDIDDFRKLDLSKPATKLTVEAEHINHIAIGDDGIKWKSIFLVMATILNRGKGGAVGYNFKRGLSENHPSQA